MPSHFLPPVGAPSPSLIPAGLCLGSASRRACYLDLRFMASVRVRQPVPARGGLYVSAWPSRLSGDAGCDRADPGKGALHPVAAVQGELPRERAAHDGVARPQPLAEFGELAGEPDDGVIGVTEHSVAAAGRSLGV